jgi:hypothetical protein
MTNQPMPPMLPGDASDVDRIIPTKPITPGEEKVPVGQPFSSFMQEAQGMPTSAASGKAPMVSPFDLPAHGTALGTSAPTFDTLLNQVNNAQSTLGDLNTHLTTPGLRLKPSTKYLVKNKLQDANTNFRVTNAKLGAAIPEEPSMSEFKGPLGKFLALVQDGQQQMQSAQSQLQDLKDKGTNMQPADFLLVQVKMNKAQQELEYTSVLLSTAVSALKQLMQVQL